MTPVTWFCLRSLWHHPLWKVPGLHVSLGLKLLTCCAQSVDVSKIFKYLSFREMEQESECVCYLRDWDPSLYLCSPRSCSKEELVVITLQCAVTILCIQMVIENQGDGLTPYAHVWLSCRGIINICDRYFEIDFHVSRMCFENLFQRMWNVFLIFSWNMSAKISNLFTQYIFYTDLLGKQFFPLHANWTIPNMWFQLKFVFFKMIETFLSKLFWKGKKKASRQT